MKLVIISFTFSDKCGNIIFAILNFGGQGPSARKGILYAPVAQGIEHRPPEAGAAVRIRPGVYFLFFKCRWR